MLTPAPADGCACFASTAALPADLAARLRDLAFAHGETFASYLAAEGDWETFWSADRDGVVPFVRWMGRYVLVVGGVLAPAERRADLLERFVRHARARRWHLSFWNIGRDQLPTFRTLGFQATKCGEEPFVRLAGATWQGKDFEWLRRQENFCLRQGLEVAEVTPDPADPAYRDALVPQLEAISRAHVEATVHGRELQYFVGRFTPLDMGHKRLFVARRGDDVEAFIVLNPCLGGTTWAIEMYRRRDDATRGVIPFAMLQAMRRLQTEGAAFCSLSLIPAVRCERAVKGDSNAARVGCVLWWNYGNWIFDLRGIYHFKSRFRPEYRDMYIVALPKASVLSMIAMGRTWGLMSFNPLRLLRRSGEKIAKWSSRRSLAEPDAGTRRVLRHLTPRAGRPGTQPAETP
jgi:phosphatidylglycerol lysyltransferase